MALAAFCFGRVYVGLVGHVPARPTVYALELWQQPILSLPGATNNEKYNDNPLAGRNSPDLS